MKKSIISFMLLLLVAIQVNANATKKTYVVLPAGKNEVIRNTAQTLVSYLKKTYKTEDFSIVENTVSGSRNILLKLSQDASLINNEAYRISGTNTQLVIEGKTSRALINGVSGLLKKIGWEFYMSFEIPPNNAKKLDFATLNLSDAPLYDTRIIFNWHNFLSGCTGWDLKDWKSWIDQSSKIGFNAILVHAYGNNPMQEFKYHDQEKALGYLSTTLRGRDWGNQHVNDVRRLYGGNLFSDFEFGSAAGKVGEKERSSSAIALMQQVFNHAKSKGVEVCYAMDVDTWMSNPQNIVNTLPKEALIEVGEYKMANPDHPEGVKYYQAQIDNVFKDYPQIDRLVAWMREPTAEPSSWSIWTQFESKQLPPKWNAEYQAIMAKHPELKDQRPYPGMFAASKIMATYRTILNGRNPEMPLLLGSWNFNFVEKAAIFLPKEIGLIPLDYSYAFDTKQGMEVLQKVGKEYKLYPVVWSQHDDHRYMGRPYVPYNNFNSKLSTSNSSGYGIIHWMTHPHDLLFNNYNDQVWKNTANQSYESSIEKYAASMLKKPDAKLNEYFRTWFLKGPQFGRETSNYFLRPDEEYKLGGYKSSTQAAEAAKQRLTVLEKVNKSSLNPQGLKEYKYQVGIEQFIVSFFENQHNAHQAYLKLKDKNAIEALKYSSLLNPEKTIEIFSTTIKNYGATRGEEGLLVSLNLRWLPDMIDLRQRTGLDDVRVNFQPTSHDPLAQWSGEFTFFADENKDLWLSKGEAEVQLKVFTDGAMPLKTIQNGWAEITKETTLALRTIRKQKLTPGKYEIRLIPNKSSGNGSANISLKEDKKEIVTLSSVAATTTFISTGGEISMTVKPLDSTFKLSGYMIKKVDK